MKISFIGAGNVATHLSLALSDAGHEIVAIYSRTAGSANQLAERLNNKNTTGSTVCNSDSKEATKAFTFDEFEDNGSEVYLISVKDDAVEELSRRLIPLAPKAIWAHTAGSLPLETIKGNRTGVFYPMQTFSKDKAVDLSKVSIFIESNTCLSTLKHLANSITENVYELDSEGRKHLHLAAVFACNFVNHCYALSEKILKEQGLPFDVMFPLIDETAAKAHIMSPHDGQTGPAIRKDDNIMSKQVELLHNDELTQRIYRLMSESIQNI